ncbi:MAG: hypothetical protein NDF56_03175 [archaeon GB-1845-036]|nr:hypothetical protein [Candidatus Culexmicrobium thermophilum]HDO20653.1 hypothetical protein [Candidatus Bathyarchaeota archaeon]
MGEKFEDVEELKAVFSAIGEFIDKIPKLINEIFSALYDPEMGRKIGENIASYYKALKDSGLPEEMVVKLTEKYAVQISTFMDQLKEIIRGIGMRKGFEKEEVKRELRRAFEKEKEQRET